jgi:hypothetical protein
MESIIPYELIIKISESTDLYCTRALSEVSKVYTRIMRERMDQLFNIEYREFDSVISTRNPFTVIKYLTKQKALIGNNILSSLNLIGLNSVELLYLFTLLCKLGMNLRSNNLLMLDEREQEIFLREFEQDDNYSIITLCIFISDSDKFIKSVCNVLIKRLENTTEISVVGHFLVSVIDKKIEKDPTNSVYRQIKNSAIRACVRLMPAIIKHSQHWNVCNWLISTRTHWIVFLEYLKVNTQGNEFLHNKGKQLMYMVTLEFAKVFNKSNEEINLLREHLGTLQEIKELLKYYVE